ncbi:LpqN/LpqT family lipoprotein [Mycobacterium sp. MYCO198283]|uniref:LpqN/LpqT family lipoprotein n=1 Tax=Mycobacterium sp. MYCO198283 TaxID=2883505 RepID=UPI001E33CC2B|nr:LpqN/LpqT family lipoprotein [Mycobacterium sp. MYCO198283]MCG5433940.1 LpqN/LpqT family lipoprotein [Mycobacterium sp. MYCO198283]
MAAFEAQLRIAVQSIRLIVLVAVTGLLVPAVACSGVQERDKESYRYGYEEISVSARTLREALRATDAQLGGNQDDSERTVCETSTDGLPLVSGPSPEYVESDVIEGCIDALLESTDTRAAATTTASPSRTAAATNTPPASTTAVTSTGATGHATTINDYREQAGITMLPITGNDTLPGAPLVKLPPIPGWKASDNRPPDTFGQIVSADPRFASDPPTITAVYVRLTGNYSADLILQYAPNSLKNLREFQASSENPNENLKGYRATGLSGSYVSDDGARKLIAQKTVVIPGRGGLYVLFLRLLAANDSTQASVATEAFRTINTETEIAL